MRFNVTVFLGVAALMPLMAQEAAKPAVQAEAKGALQIAVVGGEGAKNSIRARAATAPVVEVRDEAGKPVAGAEVVFQLPMAGPGGNFHGWLKNQTVRSDAEGKAAASGYAPNDEEGRFNIKVTARQNNKTGSAVIAQSNVRNGDSSMSAGGKSNWWKYAAAIGGVAIVGGVVAATRGDDDPVAAATTPISVTVGAVSVSGPR